MATELFYLLATQPLTHLGTRATGDFIAGQSIYSEDDSKSTAYKGFAFRTFAAGASVLSALARFEEVALSFFCLRELDSRPFFSL